ncbi:MAG: glycosyltransferase [Eubacterium sp.]|jgi:glycosyltransferase involved in cell wall biosynthesis|nr:glycosyltransferase [Eubacterium sp.]
MRPLISVIVPIYKVEKYLRKCLDSIISQTYRNLEIILVNDGSPDNCEKICDEYARADERFVVINQENKGVAAARNKGLDRAAGEYITFIDPDDCAEDKLIECLLNDITENNSDISISNPIYYFEETGESKLRLNKDRTHGCFSREQAIEMLLYEKIFEAYLPGKLYKSKLFKNIRFPDYKICEDLAVMPKLFFKCEKISLIADELYYYLQRSYSITQSAFTKSKMDWLSCSMDILNFVKHNCPECLPAAKNKLFSSCCYLIADIPFLKFKKEKDIIKEQFIKIRNDVFKDNKTYVKRKILCLVSYFGLWAVKVLVILNRRIRGE